MVLIRKTGRKHIDGDMLYRAILHAVSEISSLGSVGLLLSKRAYAIAIA